MSWCWCSVLELPQKITPTIPFLHFHYIPNIFTLRKGYVFTGVRDSVNRGGCIPACTGAGTSPPPTGQYPSMHRGRHPSLQRTVHILLECILVKYMAHFHIYIFFFFFQMHGHSNEAFYFKIMSGFMGIFTFGTTGANFTDMLKNSLNLLNFLRGVESGKASMRK